MLNANIYKKRCSDVKLKNPMANFTFNTSREHQFHINAQSLFFDRHLNQDLGVCIFSILMIHDDKFTHKNLLLGQPFFDHFNISLDYTNEILGIEGHRSDVIHYVPPAPPKPEPPTPEPKPDPDPKPEPKPEPTPDPNEEDIEDDDPIIDDIEEEEGQYGHQMNIFSWVFLIFLTVGLIIFAIYHYLSRRKERLRNQLNEYEQLE
jgi:hypothetical protein